jgi:hypothetical protein
MYGSLFSPDFLSALGIGTILALAFTILTLWLCIVTAKLYPGYYISRCFNLIHCIWDVGLPFSGGKNHRQCRPASYVY